MVVGRVVDVLTGGLAFCFPCLLPLFAGAAGVQASGIVAILPGVYLGLPLYGGNDGMLDPRVGS